MSEAAARPTAHAQRHLSRLLDRRQLLHLDRPRRRPARLAAAPRRAPDVRPRLRRPRTSRIGSRPSRSCSSPKAATGSGGMATTTRPITTSSSTSSSGGTFGTSTRCLDSPCLRSCSPPTSAPATCRCRWRRRSAFSNPVLDGRATSYFEWLPAGIVETDVPVWHHDGRRAARPGSPDAAVRVRSRAPLSPARP